MIRVEFLGPMGIKPIDIDVQNLRELALKIKGDKNIASWLDKSAVAVNDNMVNNLDLILKDGDRVSILPPVCGG